MMEIICFYPQMFEYMHLYDLACLIGGGEDSSAVLQRAGLTFMCNCDMKTPTPLGNITPDILFYELFFRNHVRACKSNAYNFYFFSDHKCYKSKPEPRVRRTADYVKKFNNVGKMQNNILTPFDDFSHDLFLITCQIMISSPQSTASRAVTGNAVLMV